MRFLKKAGCANMVDSIPSKKSMNSLLYETEFGSVELSVCFLMLQ
jgi:hypothetical protein